MILLPMIALLATTAAASEPKTERIDTMEITHKADMETVDGPAEYFTGKATITGQFQREEPSRVSGGDRSCRTWCAHRVAYSSRRTDADRDPGCWL